MCILQFLGRVTVRESHMSIVQRVFQVFIFGLEKTQNSQNVIYKHK